MQDFAIKITKDHHEVREAQKLRFQVFNLELNKGLQSSYRQSLDVDDFDPYYDHLIVRELKSGEIIGTYRLLRRSRACNHIGFYFKGYPSLGAVVCGPAALDRQFDAVDLLVSLDVHKMSSEYLNRFGLSVSEVSNAVG